MSQQTVPDQVWKQEGFSAVWPWLLNYSPSVVHDCESAAGNRAWRIKHSVFLQRDFKSVTMTFDCPRLMAYRTRSLMWSCDVQTCPPLHNRLCRVTHSDHWYWSTRYLVEINKKTISKTVWRCPAADDGSVVNPRRFRRRWIISSLILCYVKKKKKVKVALGRGRCCVTHMGNMWSEGQQFLKYLLLIILIRILRCWSFVFIFLTLV